ncbi:MAG: BrnT family toxin [Treponema sp.]|nr:BrnT family toxin [Treponema sp.]
MEKAYVSFETAALVFLDLARIDRLDHSESKMSGEERWQTLDRVGKLYFVVYTEAEDKKGEAGVRRVCKV